jgi:hypothetical protein
MTDVSELLDELARGSGPPSRLRPADIYAAGRRRHRRQVTALLATAGAAVLTLVAGVAFATVESGPRPDRPEPPVAQSGAPVIRSSDGSVAAAAAGDPNHLYAVVLDCETDTTDWYDCSRDLLRSADGGRTWQLRAGDFGAFDSIRLTALSADVLVARAEKLISPGLLAETGVHVSVDGGLTWKLVQQQDSPVQAVAADGWLEWVYQPDDDTAVAVDPRSARSAPLAAPPPLRLAGDSLRPPTGDLWLAGTDPASGRPAFAVSGDAGRTWQTHVFTDIPVSESSAYSVGAATQDGHTGFMVSMTGHGLDGNGKVWVHRTTDGGQSWDRVDFGGTAPWSYGGGASYVTPDGAHVVLDQGRDDNQSFWISRNDGVGYAKVTLTGLPERRISMGMPRPVPGGYLANSDEALYVSTDGLRWNRIVPRVP